MNTRILSRLSILSIGVALCVLRLHQATAQQEAETPEEQVVPRTDSNANEIPSDETADSAMDEPEPPSPAEEAFQRALQHEQNNELLEAIDDCSEAIRLDPKNPEYLIKRAELYGGIRNLDKAFEDSAKILGTDPNNLRARLLRGKMFELSGHTDEALSEFNGAVERNPTSSQALFERQNYFDRQGQHEKALADGMRIIQLEPNPGTGYLSQAVSHAAAREPDQAMNYASALIQQDPENPLAYAARAGADGEQGDYDRALQDAETAVKLAPDNAIAHYIRGCVYLAIGEYEKSLTDLQKAADLQPRSYQWKVGLADFLATCPDDRLRDGTKAARLVSDALKLAPNDQLVWLACASVAAENGNFEEAIKWQQRLIDSAGITAALKREHQERLEAYKVGKPYRHKPVSAKSSLR